MPDTDPIAALRDAYTQLERSTPRAGEADHHRRIMSRARAALEHYRFKPEPPNRSGWWWMERASVGLEPIAVEVDVRDDGVIVEGTFFAGEIPNTRWAPVLPPPPREGE